MEACGFGQEDYKWDILECLKAGFAGFAGNYGVAEVRCVYKAWKPSWT